MARPVVLSKALTAAVANNIALAQSLAAAGNLTLNGAAVSGGVATLDTQRRVQISSVGNDSGLTWTVKGTMQSGVAISEQVAGGNAVPVATLQDFYTVTQVSANGATAGNVTVGTNTTGSTPWVVPNAHITPFEVELGYEVISGAQTVTVEQTDDSPLAPLPIYVNGYNQAPPVPVPVAVSGMTGISANKQSAISGAAVAGIRLTVTAGTGTGSLTILQSGIRN